MHYRPERVWLSAVVTAVVEFQRPRKSHRAEAHDGNFVLSVVNFVRDLVAHQVV